MKVAGHRFPAKQTFSLCRLPTTTPLTMSLASLRRVPFAARAFSTTAAALKPAGPKPIDDSTSALDCEHQEAP